MSSKVSMDTTKQFLKSTLLTMNPPTNECNCRSHDKCPLDGKCLIKPIVYQATVTTNDNKPDQTYVGLTANAFKTRFTNHKASFTSAKKKYSTEFSKYIWQLKEKNIDHEIKRRAISPYSNTSNRCNLCLWEKYYTSFANLH